MLYLVKHSWSIDTLKGWLIFSVHSIIDNIDIIVYDLLLAIRVNNPNTVAIFRILRINIYEIRRYIPWYRFATAY